MQKDKLEKGRISETRRKVVLTIGLCRWSFTEVKDDELRQFCLYILPSTDESFVVSIKVVVIDKRFDSPILATCDEIDPSFLRPPVPKKDFRDWPDCAVRDIVEGTVYFLLVYCFGIVCRSSADLAPNIM